MTVMSRNAEIAAQFDAIAERLSLLGESWFKIRAYRRAARAMRDTEDDVVQLSSEGRLGELPGVGEAIRQKTADFLATGHIPLLDRLREQVPEGHIALLAAGLTPAQVREVTQRLGIDSLETLPEALARAGEHLSPTTREAARRALATG